MTGRIFILALTLLLAGSLLWGRCVSCRTLAPQEPVHDCCQKGSCHRPPERPAEPHKCPHQDMAVEQYAKADPVSPAAVVAALPLDASFALAPLPAPRVTATPLLVHSPPDLYLRNAVLLI